MILHIWLLLILMLGKNSVSIHLHIWPQWSQHISESNISIWIWQFRTAGKCVCYNLLVSDCESAIQYNMKMSKWISFFIRIKKVRWSVFLSGLCTICTAHLITALLLSGIQFRLPTACNVERTQEPTPGKISLFVHC